jgi:hypothetical protein
MNTAVNQRGTEVAAIDSSMSVVPITIGVERIEISE